MRRFFLYIIVSLLFVISIQEMYAGTLYTPGASIAMTGSNSEVRFDVLAVIPGYHPSLDTTTLIPTFTGAFYGSGIGWIMFSTGSYQVSLDCGMQPIQSLIAKCNLTGSGWSENIGEVSFAGVLYNPATGLLEGQAKSYAGNISFDGIALPLRPARLADTELIASHEIILTVSGANLYQGVGNVWDIGITPSGKMDWKQTIGVNGISLPHDASLAGQYDIIITDPNGGTTIIDNFLRIRPGFPATVIHPTNVYAKTFCSSFPGDVNCVDGAARIATTLIQTPSAATVYANGGDTYTMTLKARDIYGNRVDSGVMKIQYITTVKNIQIDSLDPNGNMNYSSLFEGDAFISDKLIKDFFTPSAAYTPNLSLGDQNYTISSTAPSDTTDNIIQLESMIYNALGVDYPAIYTMGAPLIFAPIYTASITTTNIPIVGIPYPFDVTVIKNDNTSLIIPTIINALTIDDPTLSSEWKDLNSPLLSPCTKYRADISIPANAPCDWNDSPSSIAISSSSSFIFNGTYIGNIPSPPLEKSTIRTYIMYDNMFGETVLYAGEPPEVQIDAAIKITQRIKLLGQSNASLNVIGGNNRADLINLIRKNVTTLSRNRTHYNDVDYTISGSSTTLTDTYFNTKRTIVIVGGDITIDTDITERIAPLVIIALSTPDGQGGNIIIKGNVRDINATLITERAITSETSNNQLYFHGMISSANTPQEIPPTTCPYYSPSTCSAQDYDLPYSRIGFVSQAPNTPYLSLSGAIYHSPIIIESDSRLMRDSTKFLLK